MSAMYFDRTPSPETSDRRTREQGDRGGRNVSQALPFVLRASLGDRARLKELAYSARRFCVAREELMSHSSPSKLQGWHPWRQSRIANFARRYELDVILTGLLVVRHAYSKAVTCLSVKMTDRVVLAVNLDLYLSICLR